MLTESTSSSSSFEERLSEKCCSVWEVPGEEQSASGQRIVHTVGKRKIAIFKNADLGGMNRRRIELLYEVALSVINNVSLL